VKVLGGFCPGMDWRLNIVNLGFTADLPELTGQAGTQRA